ncbi:MAG: radical SAM protein [Clostridia bacterium]|nr:radical SAM protein [Clostridia bacterium]
MQHRNIPIFIPHMGCPNQCVFCNQRSISGCREFHESDVRATIERSLATVEDGAEVEIAFFGGSFTGIDRDLMCRLLELAEGYVRAGSVSAIRLSTRPDYISEEILSILARYSVRTVELGIQSLSDKVLTASGRGHSAEQARNACRMVRKAGFSLVGQMMIGLPASTEDDEIATAAEICSLGASAARIYPTVVFYDTPLYTMMKNGEYTPLDVASAAKRSAAALRELIKNDVPCIRIGLCASEDLLSAETVAQGPNHPAMGELVWNEFYYEEIKRLLADKHLLGESAELFVNQTELSKVIGHRRSNLIRIERETGTKLKVRGRADVKGMILAKGTETSGRSTKPCI